MATKPRPQDPERTKAAATRPLSFSLLAGVLALAAFLRLAGVGWGLPNEMHPGYSYHPDEIVCIVWGQWLAQGHYVAHQFVYGGTLHYSILNAYHHFGQWLSPLLHGISDVADAILFGRYVVVLCSVLTVWVLHETGKRLFSPAAGLLAALMLALAPAHVFLAQTVRPDEMSTLLVSLLLLHAAMLLRGAAEGDLRRFAAAGLVLGIATSLRAPLLVFGCLPVLAWLLREHGAGWRTCLWGLLRWRLPVLLGVAALVFAVTSPYPLLHFDWLLRGVQVQANHDTTAFPDAIDRGPRFVQYGWLMLRQALGLPLYGLAVLALLLACLRPTPARLLLLAPVLCYFILLLAISWVLVRYTLPLLPMLVLLTAGALAEALQRFTPGRVPLLALVAAALAWTLAGDLAFLRVQSGRNVRDVAGAWIDQHLPAGATVAEMQEYDQDVYGNPVIAERYRAVQLQVHRGEAAKLLDRAEGIDCLVLNELLYGNMERLPPGRLSPGVDLLREVVHGGQYRLVAQITRPVEFMGIDFSTQFQAPDFTGINPGQRIYLRVSS